MDDMSSFDADALIAEGANPEQIEQLRAQLLMAQQLRGNSHKPFVAGMGKSFGGAELGAGLAAMAGRRDQNLAQQKLAGAQGQPAPDLSFLQKLGLKGY